MRPGASVESPYEVFSRLPLKPGRYEVRFAAESAGRTANVFVDVEVPDFAKADLSTSGVVLARTPPSIQASMNVLADLIPVVPTTVREFGSTDRVTAFLRIYQGGKHDLLSPSISARVVDALNKTVVEQTKRLSAADFSAQRSADYRFEIPVSTLRVGEHLLTMEITAGKQVLRRDIRFQVK
jgi:hypothetical protein